MKSLFIAILLIIPFAQYAQDSSEKTSGINWISFSEAQEAMKKEPRKIMMDVYTKWCPPCKLMMKNTFTNQNLINFVNENYYAVKFDAESQDPITFNGTIYTNPDYVEGKSGRNGVHKFSRFLGVSAYPTIIYWDEDFSILSLDKGYKGPNDVEVLLRFFAEELYKTEDPQGAFNQYTSEFKPSFQTVAKQTKSK